MHVTPVETFTFEFTKRNRWKHFQKLNGGERESSNVKQALAICRSVTVCARVNLSQV